MKAKSRRSARPVVAAVAVLLLFIGGFYTYRSLRMPKVHVKHVASQWLDQTAGKPQPHHVVRHYSTHPHPIPVAHHRVVHHHHLAKHKHQKRKHMQVAHNQTSSSHLHQASYHRGE